MLSRPSLLLFSGLFSPACLLRLGDALAALSAHATTGLLRSGDLPFALDCFRDLGAQLLQPFNLCLDVRDVLF